MATFKGWWDRCRSHAGNIALFYFAGHGLSPSSPLLLISDFGDPEVSDLWENCVDFKGLRRGMRANNAGTQLFFVVPAGSGPSTPSSSGNPTASPCVPRMQPTG